MISKEILNKIPDKKILVMGDIILDRTEIGIKSSRINPENGKAPIILANEKFYLGGAANVAKNISKIGAKCDLFGAIGNDIYGEKIIQMCKEFEIGTKGIFVEEYPTLLKARIFVNKKYTHRSDLGEFDIQNNKINRNLSLKTKSKIIGFLRLNVNKYNAIILSDYNKGFFSKNFVQEIIKLAKKYNIPTITDPKPENIEFFKNSTLICPNKKEGEKISGINYNKKNLNKISEKIHKKFNLKYIVITCSEDGAYFNDGINSKLLKTHAKKICDVTGAGDTFAAFLALGLSCGLNLEKATNLANIAAGIVVEKYGTEAPSLKEILEKIKE